MDLELEQTKEKIFFVIVVRRGNQEKYIAKDYIVTKRHLGCTVKVDRAIRFSTIEEAERFWLRVRSIDDELTNMRVRKLILTYSVE